MLIALATGLFIGVSIAVISMALLKLNKAIDSAAENGVLWLLSSAVVVSTAFNWMVFSYVTKMACLSGDCFSKQSTVSCAFAAFVLGNLVTTLFLTLHNKNSE